MSCFMTSLQPVRSVEMKLNFHFAFAADCKKCYKATFFHLVLSPAMKIGFHCAARCQK